MRRGRGGAASAGASVSSRRAPVVRPPDAINGYLPSPAVTVTWNTEIRPIALPARLAGPRANRTHRGRRPACDHDTGADHDVPESSPPRWRPRARIRARASGPPATCSPSRLSSRSCSASRFSSCRCGRRVCSRGSSASPELAVVLRVAGGVALTIGAWCALGRLSESGKPRSRPLDLVPGLVVYNGCAVAVIADALMRGVHAPLLWPALALHSALLRLVHRLPASSACAASTPFVASSVQKRSGAGVSRGARNSRGRGERLSVEPPRRAPPVAIHDQSLDGRWRDPCAQLRALGPRRVPALGAPLPLRSACIVAEETRRSGSTMPTARW